ncbi:nuclear cap-binding protein subunit 1-like [Tubulanus polymorphus]|uniref:nuclear cap-binding protein subunit 1-like n=1 Tax=Tubulanus polymorphus TaxID=672921 RepID=UPI003DA255B6
MSRRRHNSGGSGSEDEDGHSRKRRRAEVDIEDRLESLIMRVGEKSTSSLESNLEGLSSVLEADLINYKGQIIKILCDCVVRMPEKLTVYTTLVGLLNAKNYNCGGDFVEMCVRNLKEALKSGEWENARMMVRFLADLVNCHVIVAGSLLAMFDNFIEVALEDNIPQVRSDWYVYTVLSALPWVGRELFETKSGEFNNMLMTIGNYINKRQKNYVHCLRVWTTDDPHPQEEYLDCFWAQMCNLRKNDWNDKQIVRPYLAFDGTLCEALQHALPQIIPPSHNDDTVYPFPSIVFRMFDFTDVPAEGPVLPGSHAIERYLIEDQLHKILQTHHLERKDCAAALLSFPTKNKIPLNYMIVEVAFSQLFRLPRAPYLEIFYGSILIELCKLQPSSMPQVLAQATETLFERINHMNAACIERFATWFAYHLSNFQFRWSWDDWAPDCTNCDPEAPKAKFIREVLLKAIRLSYHQRLVDSVPESLAEFVPKKPASHYKYEAEGAGSLPGTMIAHRLIQAIKEKCTSEDALMILNELPNPNEDDSDASSSAINPLKIDVFVSSLLHLGRKSFSHSFAAIAKFHNLFKAFGESEESQIMILKIVYEVWHDHQQMLIVLIDKMLKTQIVECSAVANWIFSPEMFKDFTSFYIWDILHTTIKKMNRHVIRLAKELEDARDKIEAAQRKIQDGFDIDLLEEDVPTDEMLERMDERLETAHSEQKNLFLIVFQRFIMILTEHLARSEAERQDYNTPWYKWVIERLQQTLLLHHEQVYTYIQTLENLLFTNDLDPHILEVFHQFCALRK